MSEGGWQIRDGNGNDHTHTKLENELTVDRRLILESPGKVLKNHLYGDNENIYLLVDRNGDGLREVPNPLRLRHVSETGWIYDNEIFHRGNLPIESGNFTPRLEDIDSGEEAVYTERKGFDQKVGNLCFFSAHFLIATAMLGDGRIAIQGLPYKAGGEVNENIWFPIVIGNYSNITLNPDAYPLALILNARSYVRLYQQALSGGISSISATSINQDSFIRIEGIYAV